MDTPSAPAGGESSPSSAAPTPAPTSAAPVAVKPTQASAPKPTAGTRRPDGTFLPKDGTAGVSPDHREGEGEKPKPTEAQKEAWRLRTKLKINGKEEDVDLDEEGVTRELQQYRAMRGQFGKATDTAKKAQALLDMAARDPKALLAAAGHDPKKLAAELLAAEAKLGAMSPEERRTHELETELNALKSEREQELQTREEAAQAAKREEIATKTEERYMAVLDKSGMPKSHESLYYLVETDGLMQKKGIQLSDDQLVGETKRRLGGIAKAHYSSLPVEQLETELGPEKIKALLQLQVSRFEKAHAFAPAPVVAATPREEPAEKKFLTESEINANLRRMQNGG